MANTTSQKENPTTVADPGKKQPDAADHKRPRSTVGEIVMAIFVGATAVIYIVLTCVSVTTMRQARISERAWILPDVTFDETIAKDKPLSVKIHLENTGNTPAKAIYIRAALRKIGKSEPIFFDYVGVTTFGTTTGLLIPKQTYDLSNTLDQEPNKPPAPLGDANFEDLMRGGSYVILYLRIEYVDIFGIHHWTKRCKWQVYALGDVYNARPCTDYGNVDNNN